MNDFAFWAVVIEVGIVVAVLLAVIVYQNTIIQKLIEQSTYCLG